MRVVGYTAQATRAGVHLERSLGGVVDGYDATTFDDAVSWLVADLASPLSVVYGLTTFAEALFTLLPAETKRKIRDKARVYVGGTKIFYTSKMLGITAQIPLHGNFVQQVEVNIYALRQFLGKNHSRPKTAVDVETAGLECVSALERGLGIVVDKLTSPVGLLESKLQQYELPTLWSSDDDTLIDASNYALKIASAEWWQDFSAERGKVYSYDLASAYAAFIALLPDTDHCTIYHSQKPPKKWHWAIMRGVVETTSPITPIPYYRDNVCEFGRVGMWDAYLTSDEARWLKLRGVGSFQVRDGFFFCFDSGKRPYRQLIMELFDIRRKGDALVEPIVKNALQGISGKLDEIRKNGEYGVLFNPPLALMVRSKTRLAVADFIYDNGLQNDLVSVALDEVRAKRQVSVPNTGEIGTWRVKE